MDIFDCVVAVSLIQQPSLVSFRNSHKQFAACVCVCVFRIIQLAIITCRRFGMGIFNFCSFIFNFSNRLMWFIAQEHILYIIDVYLGVEHIIWTCFIYWTPFHGYFWNWKEETQTQKMVVICRVRKDGVNCIWEIFRCFYLWKCENMSSCSVLYVENFVFSLQMFEIQPFCGCLIVLSGKP